MSDKSVLTREMFTSRSEEWETPNYVIEALSPEFKFVLDVCADESNNKAEYFYTKEMDSLTRDWQEDVECLAFDVRPRSECDNWAIWCNPPYGREISKWMQKAYLEGQSGLYPVVCLVHARTDTRWFHDWAMKADEIRLIKGRIKFGDGKNSAPFPSCLVIFRSFFGKVNRGNVPSFSSIRFEASK